MKCVQVTHAEFCKNVAFISNSHSYWSILVSASFPLVSPGNRWAETHLFLSTWNCSNALRTGMLKGLWRWVALAELSWELRAELPGVCRAGERGFGQNISGEGFLCLCVLFCFVCLLYVYQLLDLTVVFSTLSKKLNLWGNGRKQLSTQVQF